jgi:hypothetical protein
MFLFCSLVKEAEWVSLKNDPEIKSLVNSGDLRPRLAPAGNLRLSSLNGIES